MMPATRRAGGGMVTAPHVLAAAGHLVERASDFDQAMGHAGAIVHRPLEGFEGASDPRSDGAAVGC